MCRLQCCCPLRKGELDPGKELLASEGPGQAAVHSAKEEGIDPLELELETVPNPPMYWGIGV